MRDKLMGRSSLDIDIALDDLLGREFADRVNEYLKAHVRRVGRAGGRAAGSCSSCAQGGVNLGV